MSNAARDDDWVPQPLDDSFGFRLWQLRRDRGWDISEAADLCGIKRTTWGQWEKGTKPQDMAEVVERIHRATHVNRSWLLWGSTSMRKANGHLSVLPDIGGRRQSSHQNRPPVLVVLPPVTD